MADADPLVSHTFIQATMARGYLAQAEAKDLFQSIAGSSPGAPHLPKPTLLYSTKRAL